MAKIKCTSSQHKSKSYVSGYDTNIYNANELKLRYLDEQSICNHLSIHHFSEFTHSSTSFNPPIDMTAKTSSNEIIVPITLYITRCPALCTPVDSYPYCLCIRSVGSKAFSTTTRVSGFPGTKRGAALNASSSS